ncbi:serine-rich adhesin for platelets-like [Argopecten irradians]|uniref:serine-rich adhesin for platelets-like n=1 Tax=Argopecten irradians TaxID=31199 RepID=UPI0037125A3F
MLVPTQIKFAYRSFSSLKCGKSSSSSSSSSSSAKRSTVDAVKEKRKIKSWVGTNKEKCSIEDVLPGLYSSDKSKLGRIPKITKIPKKGQVSSKPDSASTIVSNNISSSVNSNASTIVHPSSDVIHTDVEMSSAVELPLEVDIAPVQPSTDIIASSVINSSGISFSSEHPNANISQPAVLESVQNATMESIVSRLPAYVEKPSVDSNTHPTDGNIDDADDATEKVLESLVQRSLTSATIEVETEDSLKSEILSENISTDLTLQQTETKVENRLAANIEASENDQHDNLMDESEEMHQNLSCLDQNVMINPVPKLDIMEQSSQSSNASSCSSSKNLTVEKSSSAQEKRRKYLRKREKAESPVDSMMKSIIRSAAAKHRNSPRGWSDNERSRSPGYKSSDSERSNDARYNVKTKNNAEIEKNLQKKFDRDHFNATKIVSSTFLPDVDSNAMCHFASMEITSKAKHTEEQSSEKAVSTEHQKPAVGNRDEEVVVKNQTPSSKRERSIMPDIVIPGLGDLPLSDLNPDSRSSNVLFDPLRLSETPGYSSKKTTQSTKRERSITPEIVIPGLGDLPLKDLYGDSKPSNILYDPLKLSNTAGYERKATPAAKRERSITPEVVIPGLGDLPLPGSRANIPGLSDHLLPNNHADIMGTSESSKTSAEKPLKTSIETESTKVSCDKDISISTDDLLSIPSLDPTGDASSTTALVKDDKSVTKKSTVQDIDADDGEPVVNNTRVVERAGRELKLRVSVPNHLCGDSTVKLITLDQTIRQSLHGHRQFSRLTPTENVLVTTINRVLHKKLYEGKDKRHVEELNGQSIADRLPKKTSNTLTMAELTRNLSPSLVEFARKHLSPTVSDFTRKHDPDVDQEPSDHLSDLMSYESWGVNRNTDNLSSTRDRKPSGKSDNASSKENTSKSKPASPSIPASNLKYVPASAFVPKKGSQIGKSFMNNTKLAVGPDTSSSILDSNLPSKSTTVSPESSSNLSDNVTIRTISIAPKKDLPKTFGCSVTDKTIKEVKAPAIPDKFPSEKDKSKNENSVSTQPETVTSRLSGSASSSSSAKSVKTSSEGPSAPSTKLSENSVLPKPVSASLSSKSMETMSSSPSPARSEESVSSKVSSTKSSKSSLQSTKLSEKKVKSSGSGGALFSPIRIPDGIKSETVNKTLVPESDKTSQVGAIRSDNQLSRKERKAQSHPYTRRHRRESWSFDIPYRNLQELMRDLTANTFKQRIVNISKPQKSKNTVPRFRNYRFRRSSVPDSLPDSPDDSDEFTPDAIPDFEERKRKADMLENMQSSKKEDQEAYTAEQSSYSPGATTVAKPKPDEGKEKGVGGEENIQERLLRISKMPSPAALTTKAKASTNKDTGQGSKEKTALEKIQSESDSSNSNRKRRISQACSPNRRKDSRLSRIRHNTGQGESTHSQPIDDEILSRCRKGSSPSDSVKGGKSSQKNSRESTPFNSSVLKQGSREYSPSEFFCGTGEGKVSRENTPIDFTQDTDISKETQFVVDVPKVEVVQKKKIKIKRLEAGKSPSLSPVSSKVDDCNNPNMFRPITKPDESSGTGDLRDYLQQLKAQKSEHKLESFEISPSAGKSYEKEMPENNIKGCSDSEQTSVSGEQTSKENLVVGEREHTKDGNIFDEDMDGWIVMDEFQCPEASVLKDQAFTKEPVEDKNAPNDPENNINDHATNISEVSVREIDDMRKDLPSSCSGKIQSDTSGTTEKEFDTTDNENQVKNKDILTTSVKEGTKNSEDIISKMNTPTDSERNFIRTDNLCTQSKAEKSEEIHTQSKAEKNEEFRTQPEAEKSEEFLSETNEGDKTIIETSDMSFSETVNDYQFADPSTFVPVIYLSGTKGRKIPWAKELDSSEIGDENVGNDSKEESQPKFKEAHPLKMKELEETCQSKIDKEADVSTEQDNCESTSEVDDNDVKNTYCSESNPKILSPSELVDANPGQSVLDQTENGPTASQTSKVSTQEQNTCISEGKREDRKNLVEEEVHINTKSAACDETPEHHINTKSAACDETPEHHINTKSAACDETPEHHINTKSAACDETPEHHINTKSAACDETPEHHINTKSAACDETPEINKHQISCLTSINTKSAACDETPEHHINTKSAACDETPEHHINTKSAACDETPEHHINTKSAACDETPEHHINTKSAACDETPEHISAILDTASSETFRPKILLNISGSSTGSENLVTLVSDERCRNDTEDTEDEKVKTENSNVVKTSVDASGNPQHVVTCSRIHSRNVYGYEEENSANTSNGSTRLSCSWDFTVKQDEDSSESIYGEYHTAPKTQTQNSKGDLSSNIQIEDQFTSVLKVEKISDSNNSSCDNLLLEEKTTDNDKDLDCNYSTILTGHGSIKHESETTYSLGPCNIIDVEVQPNVLSGEESVVKVEPTIPNIGSCNTSVEESVIVKVEPTAASIEESTVEVQLYVQSAKECIVKVEPIVPNIKESIMEVQKTVPTADDKTASAVMSICVDGVSDIDCGEVSVPSNIGNKEVNLDNTSSNDGNILGINSEEVNIHRKSEEKGNVPCIGAEEEIETNIHDDDDELLQATKTCALLCHGDMFTSVTGREETTSSGQESSQGSTIKCNLSFESEYGEHHDKELMDLGEYCADLTYRLDRDIDLNHDIEVESIISSLEERKDGQDIQVSNGQFDEMKKSDLSLERHQWETLQSKLKPGGGEENFTKLEHCCPEFAMEDSKFEIKINTGNIMKMSTLAVDLNECFNKNDMDLNSSTISLESTSVDEQNKFQKKLMQPLIDRTVEMNTDTNTLLLKKSTGHCQEESIHHNTNSLVAITVDEDIVPDSQDSDSDEVDLVNISSFLKPNDSHSYESDVSFHKHFTDSHQSQSCDSGELKSRLTEKPHYVEPGVKSMKTSTPRVSPVADFFGLQCQTPVAQFTERPCTDYVYGLYKGKSELESEIPVQSTVEKPCKVDSNAFPLHVQKSPLNLSVSSKPKTSAGIPGMLYYVSPNCSDLADEEVSTGCGVNIKPITSTSGLPTNSNIKLAPPSPLKPKLLCSFEDAHVTVPMVKTEDQGGSSVNVLDTPDQNSSLAEIEAPSLESIPDNTVLPKIEDFRLQQNLIESDGDSTIPYCQESDFDEDSLGSKPSQELNYDNQQSLRPCEIVPEQTESCAQQVDISPTPSSLDVPTSILDSDLIPQPQPAQTITDLDGKNCPSTPMNLSRPSTPLNLSRPSTPLGITSPQRWVVSPPPHYGPNFWPYSPPLGYPPCAYFPYTSPLLQNPINRIWRPPFYYYPDHIPLQQHRIMPSLDPCMFHWTSATRQQLQASSLYPSLMLDSRLPLYSSYTYDRSDTHLGWYDQGTSYDVDSAYPNSNIHNQGNTPSYSNTFMQYVVHGQQVLSHSAVASPPSPPVRPVFLSTTALLSTSRTTTRDQQLMVDTPSAFTPIRPSTAMTNTGLATECVVTPENIPLPDHSPIGQAASTVTRKTELTTDKEVTLANVPLRDPDFSPSPQTSMGSQATLPPISTFAKKSRKSRKSRGKRKK